MRIMPANRETWEDAAGIIKRGGLVVFPTDTVYGVGCDPYNVAAIGRVYEAKGRSLLKALPLLLSDASQVGKVARELPEVARRLGEAFWPGALTLVVWRDSRLPVQLGGGDTIAIRVPNHDDLRALIERCGGAVAATSANLSGQPDATDAAQAAAYLGAYVDLVLDGGTTAGGVPSTLVDCTVNPPTILRAGTISREAIAPYIGKQ